MKRIAAVIVLAMSLTALPSLAVEVLRWQRLALPIPLVVGQERVLFLDRDMRVGVPAALNDRLRATSTGGAIYLLANAPIEAERLQLQEVNGGPLILLDVTARPAAVDQAPLPPIQIVGTEADDSRSEDGHDAGRESTAIAADAKRTAAPIPVLLTRHAAQNLYAPLRTVEPLPGAVFISMRRDLDLQSLLPTLPLTATALAGWRLGSYWVTAVRVKNHSTRPIELDPRLLTGNFVTATFQHPDLGPAGQATDTTVLYVVTRGHGLNEALPPAINPVGAAKNSLRPMKDHGDSHEK